MTDPGLYNKPLDETKEKKILEKVSKVTSKFIDQKLTPHVMEKLKDELNEIAELENTHISAVICKVDPSKIHIAINDLAECNCEPPDTQHEMPVIIDLLREILSELKTITVKLDNIRSSSSFIMDLKKSTYTNGGAE